MSLENGILGYLSMKQLSGYDIKKLFDMSASYFWPADQAQIYRSLKKLEDDGLVEVSGVEQQGGPSKKLYSITDKGHPALCSWLVSPKHSDYISRLPQVMQLFFSGTLNKEDQLKFLDKQLKLDYELLQQLRDNYRDNGDTFAEIVELPEGDRRLDSATYAHRWGILRGEAYAKLLEEIKEEIMRS